MPACSMPAARKSVIGHSNTTICSQSQRALPPNSMQVKHLACAAVESLAACSCPAPPPCFVTVSRNSYQSLADPMPSPWYRNGQSCRKRQACDTLPVLHLCNPLESLGSCWAQELRAANAELNAQLAQLRRDADGAEAAAADIESEAKQRLQDERAATDAARQQAADAARERTEADEAHHARIRDLQKR